MGVVAALVASAAISPVAFLQAHQTDGAFAEPGGQPAVALTAWAAMGLRAAGSDAPGSLAYLKEHEAQLVTSTDIALVALAERTLGGDASSLLAELRVSRLGPIGGTLNSTFWGILALRRAPPATVRWVLAKQSRDGGWSWYTGGQPDTNDTAAALEALAVARVRGPKIDRAVRYLLAHQNRDGGFELYDGRGSDAQSTAWAIQGLLAARRTPPHSAFRYLARLRRDDGSYRYSARYVTTPVWVTSQVVAALARKPFPF